MSDYIAIKSHQKKVISFRAKNFLNLKKVKTWGKMGVYELIPSWVGSVWTLNFFSLFFCSLDQLDKFKYSLLLSLYLLNQF